MAEMPRGNAVIGQSGGPTAVINQSLVGVVEGLQEHGHVEQVLGAVHGVHGATEGRFVDLQQRSTDRLERTAATPSAALGSSRDKPDREYCEKLFRAFEQQNVRYFFYIGGNDSSDTCRIVNELAREANYEVRCFHVPKTIDNDLMQNDHTPGFPSAAKFVAQAFQGENLDNRALPGVKINVVMGRHAGFLTAASRLAREHENDGPHLIYVPENDFDVEQFLADVEKVYQREGRCLVAVSEGVHDAQGNPILTQLASDLEKDAHGNVQLSGTGALGDHLADAVRERLQQNLGGKIRVRADTFGYIQRCMAGVVSETDAKEARDAGREAARIAREGHVDGSIAIQRGKDKPYEPSYQRVELKDVAGQTRTLDVAYRQGSNDISDKFLDYIRPLVGELPTVEQLEL
jgi:6-phosphofructokinase 1